MRPFSHLLGAPPHRRAGSRAPRSACAASHPRRRVGWRPAQGLLGGLSLTLFCAAAPQDPDPWQLWGEPGGVSAELDQSQTTSGDTSRLPGFGGRGAGQVFVPQATPLVRVDLQVRRRGDGRPGRMRIWRWRGAREATIREAPLFEDPVDLEGTNEWQLRSFFPGLEVEPGQPYYLELDTPGRPPFWVRAGLGPPDPYPAGAAWPPHRSNRPLDLWFRTYGPPRQLTEARLAAVDAEGSRIDEARPEPELPWFPPKRGPEPVRADYLQRVERWTSNHRAAVLQGCGSHAHRAAAFEAFLYHASCREGQCDEDRARDAAAMLLLAHARRFCSAEVGFRSCRTSCEQDPHVGFAWLEPPGMAYRWIRESPSLEPEDHDRIQALLADSARRAWPRRELGSHNRAIRAAVGFRLAADLVPDAPEADAWRGYADAVWEEFWLFRDTDEDSTLYNDGVFWPALLRYLEIAGLSDQAWGDPAFRALVERFFRTTLPIGAAPRYGDDAGWAYAQPGRIWLFEEAARRLGDPRYRWMARRLYAYHRDHARDDPPANDAMHNHMLDVANAWLVAEDGPVLPPPGRERAAVVDVPPGVEGWTVHAGESLVQAFESPGGDLSLVEVRTRDVAGRGEVAVAIRTGAEGPLPPAGEPIFEEIVGVEPSQARGVLRIEPLLELPEAGHAFVEIRPLDTSLTLVGASDDGAGDAGTGSWRAGQPLEGSLALRVERLEGWDASLTQRHRVEPIPRESRSSPPRQFRVQAEIVPDKLVLRSGHGPDDLVAAFNLLAGYGHGHRELGALMALVDRGSVLSTQTAFPYANHAISPQDESVPLVRRFAGSSLSEPGRDVRVERLVDGRGAAVAILAFDDPFGWGVRQQRRLALVKNRLLWVRDRFEVPPDLRGAVGPVWHAAALRAKGPHWFDLFDPAPLGNVWRFRNPERYAWLGFVPRPGTAAAARRVESYAPPPGCPKRLRDPVVSAECRAPPALVAYQRQEVTPGPAPPHAMDSLWIPHGPEIAGGDLATALVVHLDDADAVILEIGLGQERWLLVDNPAGRPLRTGVLRTDARCALVLPGSPDLRYALVLGATHLEAPGARARRWSGRADVEIGDLPAERPLR